MASSAARVAKPNKKEIEKYRRLLEEKKDSLSQEIAKTRNHEVETTEEATQDIADRAVSSYTREFLYSLTDAERGTLVLIDDALARIAEGAFGSCVNCSACWCGRPLESPAADGG